MRVASQNILHTRHRKIQSQKEPISPRHELAFVNQPTAPGTSPTMSTAGTKRKRAESSCSSNDGQEMEEDKGKPWTITMSVGASSSLASVMTPIPAYTQEVARRDGLRLQNALEGKKTDPDDDDASWVELRSLRDPESGVIAVTRWKELCSWSPVFESMRGMQMVESQQNAVSLDASPCAIRNLLSFLMRGVPMDKDWGTLDLREVWNLANMYEVQFIKDWIVARCVKRESVLAVATFACGRYEDLMGECCNFLASKVKSPMSLVRSKLSMRGVSVAGMRRIVETFSVIQASLSRDGSSRKEEAARWVQETFRLVQTWMDANNGSVRLLHQARDMLKGVELEKAGEEFFRRYLPCFFIFFISGGLEN